MPKQVVTDTLPLETHTFGDFMIPVKADFHSVQNVAQSIFSERAKSIARHFALNGNPPEVSLFSVLTHCATFHFQGIIFPGEINIDLTLYCMNCINFLCLQAHHCLISETLVIYLANSACKC